MPRCPVRSSLALATAVALLAGCPGPGPGPQPPPPPPPVTHLISGTVSGLAGAGLVLQDNGGDDLSVAASGGLDVSFAFATRLAAGAAYAVTVRTQPGTPAQACTVLRDGSGGVQAADVTTVLVDCHAARFAYVANAGSGGSDSVSAYRVDAATGRLAGLGQVAGGMFPLDVTVDPAGRHAYVPSGETGDIYHYTILPSGLLQPAPVASFSTGGSPRGLAIHPSGAFAYAAGSGGRDMVAQFTIDAGGGWTAMAPATVPAGPKPVSLTFHPGGRFAYAANASSALQVSSVSQYAVAAGGALTPLSPDQVPAGVWPVAVTVDATGRFAYATNQGDSVAAGAISQYAIGVDGRLTPLSPASVATGPRPRRLELDPSGRFAYVANSGADTISQYGVGPSGALTPLTPPTVATLASPMGIAIDPAGKHAWVACAGKDAVAQYAIGADGTLTPGAPARATAGPGPAGVTLVRGVATSATDATVYVANEGGGAASPGTVGSYTTGAGGALTPAGSVVPGGIGIHGGARALASDPTGRFLYVADTAWVSQYAIGPGAQLTPLATPTLLTCSICTAVAVHPSGTAAYVVDNSYVSGGVGPGSPNTIHQFRVDPDGSLVPFPLPFGDFPIDDGVPTAIALAPSGEFAYVVFWPRAPGPTGGGFIHRYAIGAAGRLSDVAPGGAIWTGFGPTAVVIDPSGRFAYVSNALDDAVVAYAIDPGTGALTAIDCGTGAGCHANSNLGIGDFAVARSPYGLAIDPAGAHLYVASMGDGSGPGAVSQFAIGPTGALTPLVPASVPAGQNARALVVDPSGTTLYVANGGDLVHASTVSQFAIGPGGALTPLASATVVTGESPMAITTAAIFQ